MIHESTRQLGEDLVNNAADWKPGRYELVNTRTGRALWVCNGHSFLDWSPNVEAFNFIERLWLWRRVKTCLARGALARPSDMGIPK